MVAFLLFPFCLFLSLLLFAQLGTPSCPLLGPGFPAPVRPSDSEAVIEAVEEPFTDIRNWLENNMDTENETSFSLQLYSFHEANPLFEYYFSAPALANATEGVARVDSNTIYRIGSMGKLLTVYSYLITACDASFNDPVTNHVPELADYAELRAGALSTDTIDTMNRADITIGALAGQLSGIGGDATWPAVVEQSVLRVSLPPVPSNTFRTVEVH